MRMTQSSPVQSIGQVALFSTIRFLFQSAHWSVQTAKHLGIDMLQQSTYHCINFEPKTLVGVVEVAADDEDVKVSSDVDKTVAVGEVVNAISDVDSTTETRNTVNNKEVGLNNCLLYTSPSPRDS